jgi:hypothetical protein
MKLADRLGQRVTVDGTARNAALGAVVVTEGGTPVYVAGLAHWDHAVDGRPVRATGTLRLVAGDLVDDRGEHRHGTPDDRLVLDDASWTAG